MVVQTGLMALDEFIRLYDEAPFELIDGERTPLAPTVAERGEILKFLYALLLAYEQGRKTIVVYSERPYVLTYSSDWVKGSRVPDIMIYSAERMAAYKAQTPDWKAKPYVLVPDLCIEIISPNDNMLDMDDKIGRYFEDGVRVVWLINPRRQTVTIYAGERITRLTRSATMDGGDVLPGFTLPVYAMFEG